MKCPICSNSNREYFFSINNKICCRKCLNFIKEKVGVDYKVNRGYYTLLYSLTNAQQKASDFVLENVMKKQNCAINAVCGAGKTEIIYDTLKYCLNNNMKVGIAIPRKDVVIELKNRIKKDFNVDVISVYGGQHDVVCADIIIFTTHQAFRYINYFDVLIIDEVDAFPYKGNEVLKNIIRKCSKVHAYLSATMPKYIEKDISIKKFYLNKRYHGYDLPIPKCKQSINMIYTLKKIIKEKHTY